MKKRVVKSKKLNKKNILPLILAIILVIIGFLLFALNEYKETVKDDKPQVENNTGKDYVNNTGSNNSNATVPITPSSQVSGPSQGYSGGSSGGGSSLMKLLVKKITTVFS